MLLLLLLHLPLQHTKGSAGPFTIKAQCVFSIGGLTAEPQQDVVMSLLQQAACRLHAVLLLLQVHQPAVGVHQVHTVWMGEGGVFAVRTIEPPHGVANLKTSATSNVHATSLLQVIDEIDQLTVEVEHLHPTL